jgi:hypothetical protein
MKATTRQSRGEEMTMTKTSLAILAGVLALAAAVPAQAQGVGPYSFFSLAPCRVIDTRGTPGPTGGPALAANAVRSFPVLGACGLPATAKAVTFNITVVSPTDFGDLRVYPFGVTEPLASVINWVTSDFAVANGAIVPVTAGASNITVKCDMPPASTGTVHLVVDVTGYFE